MKLLKLCLAASVLLMANLTLTRAGLDQITDQILDEQKIREKLGAMIYIGEPFLSKSKTFTDLFYDLLGVFSFHIWDGFLAGLYSDSQLSEQSQILNGDDEPVGLSKFLPHHTCLGNRSLQHLKKSVLLTETTTKEVFFMHLAQLIREIGALVADVRENCHLD